MLTSQSEPPKISCATVTTGRLDKLHTSVRCYVQQTYPVKELVIVSQGDKEVNAQIRDFVYQLGRKDIFFIEAPECLSLGAMRNLSVELTTGSIVCQWDDDDICHPQRLQLQYSKMQGEVGDVVLLSSFLKYFCNTNDLYYCDWSQDEERTHRYLCGTVMFQKRIFHDCGNRLYPEDGAQSIVEEDLNALERMSLHGKIVGLHDQGHCYVYVYHGANTYDLEHHEMAINPFWKKKVLPENELIAKRKLIEQTLRAGAVDKRVDVRSFDDVAFTYEP